MSTKELALETIRKLPATASWAETEERIHFCAAIERGRNDILSGEVVPHNEVKENLKEWITK
jgi:predicted transcriptional regulator